MLRSLGPSSAPLDLQSLRCFVSAAHAKNFRLAAKQVGLSPAAFSDRIQRLEQELEHQLFERTTRSVRLSRAGERLMPEAEECLRAAGRCFSAVHEPAQAPPFELTIGTRYELGMSFLVPALGDLEKSAPERRLHTSFGDTPELLSQLKLGQIDAFISSARLIQPRLSVARLHEERYVLVASPALIKSKPLRRAADAQHHTLLELARDLPLIRYFLDARPPTEVWAFARTQLLGSIGPIRLRALEGAGVAILPHYFVADDLKRGKLKQLFESQKLATDWFRLVWQKGHPRDEELHKLAGELANRSLR